MSQSAFAQGAYTRAMIATAGPRSIEAEAFEKINGELMRASRIRSADYPSYVRALSRNLSLWTILAADVARDDNPLPADTRAMIWRIAAFVRQRTQALMQAGAAAELAALIDINANMIAGLKPDRPGAKP